MRAKGQGCITRIANSPYWYILYYHDGRQVRESTKSTDKKEAERLLQIRLGEQHMGIKPAQDTKNVKYEDVRDALVAEYKLRRRGSVMKHADGTEYISGMNHLDRFFKNMPVARITSDVIRRYIEKQRGENFADATIRRNLVILRSMLNLARKEGKLRSADLPHFPMPEDSEPAGQYIAPEGFAKVHENLPADLRPFFTFMYHTGCRLGAAMGVTWEMVSKDCTEIKIPAALMKAREPLTLVLAGPGLEQVAKELRKMFRSPGGLVFDTTNYRPEWAKAIAKAGLGTWDKKTRTRTGPRIHDCRCSAAVNLVEAGVAEDIVMKIGGWKTRAMFSRYNVMSTDRVRRAMERGGQYVEQRAKNGTI